jgi:hypothetical protein
MGGLTFPQTISISKEQYNNWMKNYSQFLTPYRLSNKQIFHDIDFICFNESQLINQIKQTETINCIKTISLFEDRFQTHSTHLLTSEFIQIDILIPYCENSKYITQAYFSYSFANIFLKKLVPLACPDFKLSYLGILCHNNQRQIDVEHFRLDQNTRLIIDVEFLFQLIDLDYNIFKQGFQDEFELLHFLKTSKFYNLIKFNNNSKFKHDCKRLQGLQTLVDQDLIHFVSTI